MKKMNFPTYTAVSPVGPITYGYKREYRKWSFHVPGPDGGVKMLVGCHGQEQAHKVARQIVGGLKRTGGTVDSLCRKHILRIVENG